MSDASIVAKGDRSTIRLERRLADPPSVVWQALTDREQLRSWFPCDVIVEGGRWKVGAEISFPFPPDVIEMTLTGVVLIADEPRELSFRWGEDILRFELTGSEARTDLVLFNELSPDTAARNAAGWDVCLDLLAGIAPGPGGWQSRFDRYCTEFEAILGPQQGPPDSYKGEL